MTRCSRFVPMPDAVRWLAALLLCLAGTVAAAQVTLTRGTNFAVDAAPDGRLAVDMLGGVWVLPGKGGVARPVATGALPVSRPRWSPDGTAIVYQAHGAGLEQVWLYDFASDTARPVGDGRHYDQQPDWHPDGSRVVFSSDRRDSGFDLWETDLATGLSWRLTRLTGDETEPAWSADGRDLVYVHHDADQWSIVVRRFGEPERVIESAAERLSAPAWRPDGSLVTFLRHGSEGLSIDMAILSEPPLLRTLVSGEDFFVAPVAWTDRDTLLYTADGVIRQRDFNAWTSRSLPFRITVDRVARKAAAVPEQRRLPEAGLPDERLVLRVGRLFDGISAGYRGPSDILIDKGRITAIEEQRDRSGSIVVDMGNLTALPGLIDAYATLPDDTDPAVGPLLLSFGVTAVVAEHSGAADLGETWTGKELPGPRVLAAAALDDSTASGQPWLLTLSGDMASGLARRDLVADRLEAGIPVLATNWQVGVGAGATYWLGADALPASPGGARYEREQLGGDDAEITVFSGLADALTPGVAELLTSRQAALLGHPPAPARRFPERPVLGRSTAGVVLASRPNGLPPGIAQHAELRALQAAGLPAERALRAAGVNAAAALRLGAQLGRIAVGSGADIVVVDGDPLTDVSHAGKVVGVIRNGRFFSAIGLIERARAAGDVE